MSAISKCEFVNISIEEGRYMMLLFENDGPYLGKVLLSLLPIANAQGTKDDLGPARVIVRHFARWLDDSKGNRKKLIGETADTRTNIQGS